MSFIYSNFSNSFFNMKNISEIYCDRENKCISVAFNESLNLEAGGGWYKYQLQYCDEAKKCEKCNQQKEMKKYIKRNLVKGW